MRIRFVWEKAPKSLGYRNEEKNKQTNNQKTRKIKKQMMYMLILLYGNSSETG